MSAFERMFGRAGWRRVRAVATVTIAAVVAVAVFVDATSRHNRAIQLGDGGAWLVNSAKGEIVHVDGPTHEANAAISGVSKNGQDFGIQQAAQVAWIVDPTTGTVRPVDSSSLTVGPGARAPNGSSASALQLLVAPDAVYRIDRTTGTVWLLTAGGSSSQIASFDGPIEGAIARDGTLWVTASRDGSLVQIRGKRIKSRRRVFPRNDDAVVMVVEGRPIVVDEAAKIVVSDAGTKSNAPLGAGIAVPTLEQEGGIGWIAVGSTTHLVGVSPDAEVTANIALGSSTELGAPVTNAALVYVPDYRMGDVIIVDPRTGQIRREHVGSGTFQLLAQNGYVFASVDDAATAIVIDPDGRAHGVDKNNPVVQRHQTKQAPLPKASPISGLRPSLALLPSRGLPAGQGQLGSNHISTPHRRPDPPVFVGTPTGNKQTISAIVEPASPAPEALPTSYILNAVDVSDQRNNPMPPVTVTSAAPVRVAVTGLRNGHSYLLSALARNNIGSSGVNRWPKPVYVSDKDYPGAPNNVQVDPSARHSDGQLSISWIPPTDTKGWDLDGYDVTVTGSDHKRVSPVMVDQSQGTHTTVTGLTNGVRYLVLVAARVIDGGQPRDGDSSAPTVGEPFTKPDAAQIQSVVPNASVATVLFVPGFDGGRPAIYDALVDGRNTGVSIDETSISAGGGQVTLQLNNLADSQSHSYSIRAHNNAGATTSGSLAVAFGIPGTPSISSIDVGDGYFDLAVGTRPATLNWIQPSFDGGEAIWYTVQGQNIGNATSVPETVSSGQTFPISACDAVGCSPPAIATIPTLQPYRNINADVSDETTAPSRGPCAGQNGAVVSSNYHVYPSNTGTCALQGSSWQATCEANGASIRNDSARSSSRWYGIRSPGGGFVGYLSQWWVGGFPGSLQLPACP